MMEGIESMVAMMYTAKQSRNWSDPDGNRDGENEEIDEITEGGNDGKGDPGSESHSETLQEFLSNTFGGVEGGDPLPAEDGRPVLLDAAGDLITRFAEDGTPILPSLEWIKNNFKTKSAAIRFLISQGHSVTKIAKFLNVKYQHVRNVNVTHLKRGPNEDWNLERRRLSEKLEQEQLARSKPKD